MRHFLACEDIAGGSDLSAGEHFFVKYIGPSGGSQLSGGGIIILRVIRRHFLVWTPTVSLFRWLLFVDHVDLAAPRAQTRWMRARPRKGTTGAGAADAPDEGCTSADWSAAG